MSSSLFDLRGRSALVTGGNSGIGLGMAMGLAAAGARVCVWGTNPGKNQAALEELRGTGADVHALVCDVSDEAAVEQAFAKTLELIGPIDACFANAGISSDRRAAKGGFANFEYSEWRRLMAVNLDGAFFTMRAAARHMLAEGSGGSLVATSSLSSIRGMPRGEHYSATKGAINALVRSMAVEYGSTGIRVNALLPGWIKVPRNAPTLEWDRMEQAMMPRIPMGRWGTKEDFAGIAVYLASGASRYHTGDTIVIDGGHSVT